MPQGVVAHFWRVSDPSRAVGASTARRSAPFVKQMVAQNEEFVEGYDWQVLVIYSFFETFGKIHLPSLPLCPEDIGVRMALCQEMFSKQTKA